MPRVKCHGMGCCLWTKGFRPCGVVYRIRCHENSQRNRALLSRDSDSSYTWKRGFSVMYERDRTKLIVLSGLLTALSIVFSRLFAVQILLGGVGALRLGLGPLPVIIAGFLGGPWIGAAVGAAADLIGYVINPFGAAFVPHITAVSTLTGMLPALILRVLRLRTDAQPGFISHLIAIAISQAALHIGAMTLIVPACSGSQSKRA